MANVYPKHEFKVYDAFPGYVVRYSVREHKRAPWVESPGKFVAREGPGGWAELWVWCRCRLPRGTEAKVSCYVPEENRPSKPPARIEALAP